MRIVSQMELSANLKVVLFQMIACMDFATHETFVSAETIAKQIKRSRRAVQDSIAELVKLDLLSPAKIGGRPVRTINFARMGVQLASQPTEPTTQQDAQSLRSEPHIEENTVCSSPHSTTQLAASGSAVDRVPLRSQLRPITKLSQNITTDHKERMLTADRDDCPSWWTAGHDSMEQRYGIDEMAVACAFPSVDLNNTVQLGRLAGEAAVTLDEIRSQVEPPADPVAFLRKAIASWWACMDRTGIELQYRKRPSNWLREALWSTDWESTGLVSGEGDDDLVRNAMAAKSREVA